MYNSISIFTIIKLHLSILYRSVCTQCTASFSEHFTNIESLNCSTISNRLVLGADQSQILLPNFTCVLPFQKKTRRTTIRLQLLRAPTMDTAYPFLFGKHSLYLTWPCTHRVNHPTAERQYIFFVAIAKQKELPTFRYFFADLPFFEKADQQAQHSFLGALASGVRVCRSPVAIEPYCTSCMHVCVPWLGTRIISRQKLNVDI